MTEHRDRAGGWKHAKISGHENESNIENLMKHDCSYQEHFLQKIGKPSCHIKHVDVGGICEKNVECVFSGETTKSKTDMYVLLDDGSKYNVSIKKSLGGQVYLITDSRFISGFEMQYNCKIPENVKRAIQLFWDSAQDTKSLVDMYGTQKTYEYRKHRLVADSLCAYNKNLYDILLNWFKENVYNIADFCFSKGLAKNSCDWADYVWYKNELGETSVDEIFSITDMCELLNNVAQTMTEYGTRGGGTTIQLPFGFVQWHSPTKVIPGCMQFHHDYEKIKTIMNNKN